MARNAHELGNIPQYGHSSFAAEHVQYQDHNGDEQLRELSRFDFERGPPHNGQPIDGFAEWDEARKREYWTMFLELEASQHGGQIDHLPGATLNVIERNRVVERNAGAFVEGGQQLNRGRAANLLEAASLLPKTSRAYWLISGILGTIVVVSAITIPTAISQWPDTDVPQKPLGIKVTDLGGGKVKVTWEMASEGAIPTGFFLALTGTAKHEYVFSTDTGSPLEHVFENVAPGTYMASVTPGNAIGRGDTLTVKNPLVIPTLPVSPPDRIGGLDTLARPNLIEISWKPAASGEPATYYLLKLAKVDTGMTVLGEVEVISPGYLFGNLEPGSYQITVTPANAGGTGDADITNPITVVDGTPGDPVQWHALTNATIVQYWQKQFSIIKTTANTVFFANALNVVARPDDDNPALPWQSYAAQLQLARFLFLITLTPDIPENDTTNANGTVIPGLKSLATTLRNRAEPPFPAGPFVSSNGSKIDDLDPRPLWRAARALSNGGEIEDKGVWCAALGEVIGVYLGRQT